MHECAAVLAVCLTLGWVGSNVFSRSPAAASISRSDEIAQLIKQLGDDRWRVRRDATMRLRQIGRPALPALREALKSPDFEVKARARMLWNDICLIAPEKLAEQRARVQEAFRNADYPAMMKHSRGITRFENAEMLDWLWMGHACQLGGRWADAVEAYRKVVSFMDADIRGGLKPPPGANGRKKGAVVLKGVRMGPVQVGPVPLSPRERKGLINQRTVLMMWIARMQRVALKSPKSAAKTLADAISHLESSKTEIDYVWLKILKESPPVLHDAGDLSGAIRAWKRFVSTRKRARHKYFGGKLVDVERIAADIAGLPPGAQVPDVPWIFFLSPRSPSAKLMPDDPKTRDRSYHPARSTHWRYAFAPPAGREFDTIELACDIEQLKLRYGGHLRCYVMNDCRPRRAGHLGGIGWPREKTENGQLGREVVKATFRIPPGARLVHIETGSWKDNFKVHSVSAEATFRPVTKNPRPIPADAWMQTELHPPNGTLTWGEMKLADQRAYSGIKPGRHTLRYSVPGRGKALERAFEVKPGRRYGVFVNLDSPFRWTQLELALTGTSAVSLPRVTISRLSEGGYLAVWCGRHNKIMASRSTDLVHWSDPAPLPFNSIFDNIEPATFRAADGTIWLAFFSNRLSLQTTSTGGYRLWITRTRDGRTWAPIRKIEIGQIGGWPMTSPNMLRGPRGRHWIFWRNFAGAADSLDRVRELGPIEVPKLDRGAIHLWNPHVRLDEKKRFHMVCDNFGDGIYHLTSTDGLSWSRPRLLVEKQKDRGPAASNPQLILADGKAILLYGGAYLVAVRPDGKPVPVGQGVKITCHLAPLAGSRIFRGDGGKVFLLTGNETTWLLEAHLKDLLQ